jgi:manganese/zinc/iron transport system permease protein
MTLPLTGKTFPGVLGLLDPVVLRVLTGTALLGLTAGVVGVFMLLRRKSLLGDVVGHAALPGIGAAFLLGEWSRRGSGRSLPALLAGAFVAGLCGALCVTLVRRAKRVHTDAALAVVLSTFYGLGGVLLSVIQRIPEASSAGLSDYIKGQSATLVAADVHVFAWAAVLVLGVLALLFKEFTLLCFDEDFAASQGWPVWRLDGLLTLVVVAVTVIGMRTVGLLLITAVLVIPASAARFWSDRLAVLTAVAALIGAGSSAGGVLLSSLAPWAPAGPVIVLVGGAIFLLSLLWGPRGGLVRQALRRLRQRRLAERLHLLRALYEQWERAAVRPGSAADDRLLSAAELSRERDWTSPQLDRLLSAAVEEGLLHPRTGDGCRFTPLGLATARRTVRNHRLWELYLLKYADVAAAHVDQNADLIEHVLDLELVAELEASLPAAKDRLPPSPHVLRSPTAPPH